MERLILRRRELSAPTRRPEQSMCPGVECTTSVGNTNHQGVGGGAHNLGWTSHGATERLSDRFQSSLVLWNFLVLQHHPKAEKHFETCDIRECHRGVTCFLSPMNSESSTANLKARRHETQDSEPISLSTCNKHVYPYNGTILSGTAPNQ